MSLSSEQLALRATGYGASEVPTVIGVPGAGRIIEIFEDKALGIRPGLEEGDGGLAARLGVILEDPTANEYALRTGSTLVRVATLRHPTRPLALATPDRARFLTVDDARRAIEEAFRRPSPYNRAEPAKHGVLDLEGVQAAERLVEVKTTASRNRRDYGAEGSGVVPEDKAIQATWQMGVTGKRVVDIPVLFRGEWGVKFAVFTVGFNEALFDALYEAVERFHTDHVLAKKPPPPDGSERYDEFQKRAYPTHSGVTIIASETDEELMLRWAKIHEAAARIDKAKKKTRQEIVERIGTADGISSSRLGSLTFRKTKDTTEIDWQQAANEALTLGGLVLGGMQQLHDSDAKPSTESIAELARRLQEIVPAATKTKPGHRVLRPSWKGEADLELAKLQLMLDAMEEAK